jgi:hypothetical protein
VSLEVLNLPLVQLGFLFAGEGAEIAALAGGRVLPAGVETVFAGFEFANHTKKRCGLWGEGKPGKSGR